MQEAAVVKVEFILSDLDLNTFLPLWPVRTDDLSLDHFR